MKKCDCGSIHFTIEAVYAATDHIRLHDDGSEDFDIIDTSYGDGEWEDWATVTCSGCGKTTTYSEWNRQEEDCAGKEVANA